MSSAAIGTPAVRLAIACVLVLSACSAPAGDTSSAPTMSTPPAEATAAASPSAAPSASAPAGDAVEDQSVAILENVTGEPDWPLEGFGSLWLLAPDSDEPALLRVDPATNEITAAIRLPGNICQGFTVTDDAVWACTPNGVVRIDPATNAITGEVTFDTPEVFSRLAFGAGSVWALGTDGFGPNVLVRIDPVASTAAMIPLGHGAATLAFGFDAVWVTAPQDGLVLRVDSATQEITEHATGLTRPWTIAVGPDSLWVTLYGNDEQTPSEDDPTVVRIDPADGSIVTEIATGAWSGNSGGLWAEAEAVWVRAPDAFLVRIDPATNEVVDRINGPVSGGDVTVAFGSVWATASQALTVYRVGP